LYRVVTFPPPVAAVSLSWRSSAYSQWSVDTAMHRQTNDVSALMVVDALSMVFFEH